MTSILCKGLLKIIPNFSPTKTTNICVTSYRSIFLQSCLFRAKQSTRARKLKLNKKRRAHNINAAINKSSSALYSRKKHKNLNNAVDVIDDSGLNECKDNVWFMNMFKLRQYSFIEAANALRESHHPTMYNEPNAFIHAFIELDMSTDKKTKFFENFVDVVTVKYPYKHNEDRSVLAFCKTKEQVDAALEAGATLAGGVDVITAAKRGKIVLPDFQFVVAHPQVMHDLIVIRGLLKRKYPSFEAGTLGTDLPDLIQKFKIGIRYESKRDEINPRFGWVDVALGKLDTDTEHLEDNLRMVLQNIRRKGPRRTKNTEGYKFIRRCFIQTKLHQEKLLIPVEEYYAEENIIDSDDEDEAVGSQ